MYISAPVHFLAEFDKLGRLMIAKDRSMLAELLATELGKRFAERGLILNPQSRPTATIPPKHHTWTPIQVFDDGDEVTVFFGGFTHVHFGNYDDGLTPAEREGRIVADVVAFLDDVFADKVEFFGTRFGGGCRPRGSQGKWSRRLFGDEAFVWSGPAR